MDEKVLKQFDYYYGAESESFNFIQVPKFLFHNPDFRNLKSDSKILYSLMLERMSWSRKNEWFDEKKRVYIIYPMEEIMSTIGCGHTKCIELLKELSCYGLIEKKRRGLGKPDIIYVKDFLHELPACENEDETTEFRKTELWTSEETQEVCKTELQTSEKQNSGLPQDVYQDFRESEPNNKDNNKTELIKTDLNKCLYPEQNRNNILSDDDAREILNPVEVLVKQNICYDRLIYEHPGNIKLFDYIVRVMCELLTELGPRISIAKNHYEDVGIVRRKINDIRYEDIVYLLDQLPDKKEGNINDPKSFMRTCLFNVKERTEAVCYTNQIRGKKSGSREYDFDALMKCINA